MKDQTSFGITLLLLSEAGSPATRIAVVAAELNQHHPRRFTNRQASALSSSLGDDDSPGSDGP